MMPLGLRKGSPPGDGAGGGRIEYKNSADSTGYFCEPGLLFEYFPAGRRALAHAAFSFAAQQGLEFRDLVVDLVGEALRVSERLLSHRVDRRHHGRRRRRPPGRHFIAAR